MTAPTVKKRRVLAMTDMRTKVTHLVDDQAMGAGRRAGRYRAACGTVVLPGGLKDHSERYCPDCARWMARR